MEKIFCEEPIKPELSDDILMHYGVKGMKWRRRKAKTRKNSNTSKFRSSTSSNSMMNQLSKARTNEERAALTNAILNYYTRGSQNFRKVGSTVVDNRGNKLPTRMTANSGPILEETFRRKETNRVKKKRSSK